MVKIKIATRCWVVAIPQTYVYIILKKSFKKIISSPAKKVKRLAEKILEVK